LENEQYCCLNATYGFDFDRYIVIGMSFSHKLDFRGGIMTS